jgi:hypothetical protein
MWHLSRPFRKLPLHQPPDDWLSLHWQICCYILLYIKRAKPLSITTTNHMKLGANPNSGTSCIQNIPQSMDNVQHNINTHDVSGVETNPETLSISTTPAGSRQCPTWYWYRVPCLVIPHWSQTNNDENMAWELRMNDVGTNSLSQNKSWYL